MRYLTAVNIAIFILLLGFAFLGWRYFLYIISSKKSCLNRLNKALIFNVDISEKIAGSFTIPGNSSLSGFELNCCPDDHEPLVRKPIFNISRGLYSKLKQNQGLTFTDKSYQTIEKAPVTTEYVIGKVLTKGTEESIQLDAVLKSENNDRGCSILLTLPGYKGNYSREILESKLRCLLKFVEDVK